MHRITRRCCGRFPKLDEFTRGEGHDSEADGLAIAALVLGRLAVEPTHRTAGVPAGGCIATRGCMEATPGIEPGYTALQAVA